MNNILQNDEFSQFRENKNDIQSRIYIAIIYLLLLLATLPFSLYSQQVNGGYAEAYLFRNIGARAIGMAGAYSAVANDPTSIYYNPAGIALIGDNSTIESSVSTLSLGRTHAVLTYGQNIDENYGFAVGVNSLMAGSFTSRNLNGTTGPTMTDYQTSFNIGGAYTEEFMSIGANLRYNRNDLMGSGISGQGVGLDIGTKFNVFNMFTIGVAMQNVASYMFWNTTNSNLELVPYTLRAGVGMEYGFNDETYTTRSSTDGEIEEVYLPPTEYFLFTVETILRQNDITPSVITAFEIVPDEVVAIRGGVSIYGEDMGKVKILPANIWGAGVSLRPSKEDLNLGLPFTLHLEYAVCNEFIAGSGISHNISLRFIID